MKTRIPAFVVLGLTTMTFSFLPAQDSPKAEGIPDPDTLARKIVTQCAGVKDGDLVQLAGGVRDIELLEAMNVELAKVGAYPLFTLSPSDKTARRLYLDVPAGFDSRVSPLGMKLAETITASIIVESAESESVLADVPPSRINAQQQAGTKVFDTLLKRGVRQVSLGNGMYPTEARAKQFGMTKADLGKIYYDGLNVNYDKMKAAGEAVRQALTAGRKVHFTTPEGTDLTMDIVGRPAIVNDGILSDEKVNKGGAACQVWLPAGEVFLVPVPGTAEGKIVSNHQIYEGKPIRELTLTFQKGKLTDMKATSGLERVRALYDAAGAGKDELGVLDVGINPAVRLPKGSPGVYVEAGSVSIGIGNNLWAGGENKGAFNFAVFLRGGTLEVDGKVLIQEGTLKITP